MRQRNRPLFVGGSSLPRAGVPRSSLLCPVVSVSPGWGKLSWRRRVERRQWCGRIELWQRSGRFELRQWSGRVELRRGGGRLERRQWSRASWRRVQRRREERPRESSGGTRSRASWRQAGAWRERPGRMEDGVVRVHGRRGDRRPDLCLVQRRGIPSISTASDPTGFQSSRY